MSSPRAPVAGARFCIDLAVCGLPTRADRERYYAEFVAELYGLSPADQLRHVAGFLSQAFALRAALGASRSPTEETAVHQTPSLSRTILCRAFRHHDWHTHSTDDGGRYESCAVCHRDRTPQVGLGAHFGAFAGSGCGGGG
jgi:hypothetical protein